jgi:hypothetical protein
MLLEERIPVHAVGWLPEERYGRAAEIQGSAAAVRHHLHDVRILENRRKRRRCRSAKGESPAPHELGSPLHRIGVDIGLVALDVHNDVVATVCWQRGNLSYPIGARWVVRAGHRDLSPRRAACRSDLLCVGCDDDLRI